MKTKLIPLILWILTIGWMIVIFTLSSQSGTQTAKTSSGIAQKIAEVIYQQPTEAQVDQVHSNIRKLAHVSFFTMLGFLSFLAAATTFSLKKRSRKIISILVAIMLTSAYGFFDEWHKQFIVGRHFQLDESALNIISGIVGVLIVALICLAVLKFKKKSLSIKNIQ